MEEVAVTTADGIVPLAARVGVSTYLPGEVGTVATRDLAVGEIVGENPVPFDDLLCSWEEFEKFDKGMQAWIIDFCLGSPEGFFIIENPNHWPIIWHMNHHCDGNIGFDEDYNFVVIKPIAAGEELTYDYGLGESNPKFTMECLCGSASCRGTVTGNDWMALRKKPEVAVYMLPDLR